MTTNLDSAIERLKRNIYNLQKQLDGTKEELRLEREAGNIKIRTTAFKV